MSFSMFAILSIIFILIVICIFFYTVLSFDKGEINKDDFMLKSVLSLLLIFNQATMLICFMYIN
jgi:hypothetical protein